MTIELHDAVNGDGLFDIQGKAFHALATLNTARLTTVPDEVTDFLTQFQLYSGAAQNAFAQTMEGLPTAVAGWQVNGSTLTGRLKANLENMLVQFVKNDAAQPEYSLTAALEYLIAQMEAGGDYVDPNTISLSIAAGAGNVGDVAVCYSHLRGDGLAQQNILAETIAVEVTTGGDQPQLQFRGLAAEAERLSEQWPKGSNCRLPLSATSGAGLLSNGTMETTTIANVPDDWVVVVGTPGTTVKVTAPEVQTVAIAGTPTGGSYLLSWENPASVTRSTATLSFDATASQVQTALRAIPGLEQVTVSSSGTSPDLTHTITFTGVAGNIAQLTSVSHLTGGTPTITHNTTTAGSAGSFKGRALELASNGSEVTALYHPLGSTLQTDTVYFLHCRMLRSGTITAGEIRLEIVDGIGGSVVNDDAGNANELVIDPAELSDSAHDSKWFAFRLPAATSFPVYLRLRISTAITNACSVFVDEVAIAQGARLYAGGPYVAAFAGAVKAVAGDEWTLTVNNNRGGLLQEWYNRVFAMADKDLLLPVSGSNLIPDSVVG